MKGSKKIVGLSEQDFQEDEAARDCYEIYTEVEENALTLQSTPTFMEADEYNTLYPGGLTQ